MIVKRLLVNILFLVFTRHTNFNTKTLVPVCFEEPDSYIWNMHTPCNTSVSLQHINYLMAFSIKVGFF